jgi:hypothetical protein
MTPIVLLEQLKLFTEAHTADLLLPVRPESGEELSYRAAEVHLMRLPEKGHATKKAPYVLLQLVTGSDELDEGKCFVRVIACVYSDDESEGAMLLLNLITRIRAALLEWRVVGGQFALQMPLEYVLYTDDTAPYFLGEMSTNWSIPTIERKVSFD